MASTLPPNTGTPARLLFKKIRTESLRESISTGVLDDLEYGLLKGSSKSTSSRSQDKMLGFGNEEKAILLNMEVDELLATQGSKEIEVKVRSLCYSRGVTADYLASHERFNMKQCILVLGDLGRASAPWAELVQPAVILHRRQFNILWVEVKEFASNPQLWLKLGPELLRGLLKHLAVKHVSVLARGIGGHVFLEALARAPEIFGRTHYVFNLDMPPGKGQHLPIFELEEVLRKHECQVWFSFKDDQNYDRFIDGTPQKAYDAVQKLQARLVGERQRTKRTLNYDEILITENLNANPKFQHLNQLQLNVYQIFVFSGQLLDSLAYFYEVAPGVHQDGMEGGLVGNSRARGHLQSLAGEDPEPMAVRRTRVGHLHGLSDRNDRAKGNAKRLKNLDRATSQLNLMLPDVQNGQYPGFQKELAKRLEDQGGSRGSSRAGSRPGSRSDSRVGSRAGSRLGTKEGATTLPSMARSATAPDLPALADGPGNSDDEEDEDGDLMSVFKSKEEVKEPKEEKDQEPWQNYRKMWQSLHGKKSKAYTHPMKEF